MSMALSRARAGGWRPGWRPAAVLLLLWPLLSLPDSVFGQLQEVALQSVERATVRITAGNSQSSGVLISPIGHLLTADHGLPVNAAAVRVQFADGRQFSAEVLVRDTEADAAVLKLIERPSEQERQGSEAAFSADWLPLARRAAAVEVGEMLLAAGFPARESADAAVVFRLGRVQAADGMMVQTSCLLTVGDSGGPLVNRLGEVVGIHRQIGVGRETNVHVSVARLQLLVEAAALKLQRDVGDRPSLWSAELRGALPEESLREAALSTVEILAAADAPEMLMLGARISPQSVVAKLSLLRPGEAVFGRFADGGIRALRVVSRDVAADLVLLEPAVVGSLPPLGKLSVAEPRRGDVVFAVAGFAGDGRSCKVSGPGIISRVGHTEPRVAARLGLVLENVSDGSGLRVREAAANGPGAIAGLRMGDVLHGLQGKPTADLSEFAAALEPFQPGDWLELELGRAGQEIRVMVQAGHDPAKEFDRREFLDGRLGAVSSRRTGFVGLIQHDAAVEPWQCGGLLLSSEGRILGWNVVRRSREATFGWPWMSASAEGRSR